jgi:cell division protein FtsB
VKRLWKKIFAITLINIFHEWSSGCTATTCAKIELELERKKVTNTQLIAEIEELKPELENEKAINSQLWAENTQLRAEIEALKSEAAEIEWLRSELKRERSVSNALSVMITTVHKT